MLSNKRSFTTNEQELLNLYNEEVETEKEVEEYIIYEDQNEDTTYDEYKIVLDDNNYKEEIKETEEKSNEEKPIKEKRPFNFRILNKIINIIFVIIMILLLFTTIDVILVGKYEIGPFFAIPVKKYKDGGTKEYYGFGYKVFNYNQTIGRKDKEVGKYSLKYNTNPIDIDAIDLGIEFNNDENKTYKKYYKKFLRITGTLENIDTDNNKIVISYIDEDKKYSININCKMATNRKELSNLIVDENIIVIGTVYDYDLKTSKTKTTLYLKNCFAEQ